MIIGLRELVQVCRDVTKSKIEIRGYKVVGSEADIIRNACCKSEILEPFLCDAVGCANVDDDNWQLT